MKNINTRMYSLCCGGMYQEAYVIVDVESSSFPIPEGFKIDKCMDYTLHLDINGRAVSVDLTYDDKNFLVERPEDKEWVKKCAEANKIKQGLNYESFKH